jgi:deoxyribonuclease-2
MTATPLTVIGDNGAPVDWWFIYKISKESQSPSGQVATGREYLYYDSEMAKQGQQPVLSQNAIDSSGALLATYGQLFTADAKANRDLGFYCYNDEDRFEPPSKSKPQGGGGTGPSPCGHCKGVVAFDLASDTAFWLIHSVPLLPMQATFAYPPTGLKEAQTMLCIQLANADATKAIAQLMYDAHGPNVNVASDLLNVAHDKANNFPTAPVTNVPGKLGYVKGSATLDPRLLLMQNLNGSSGAKPKPYSGRVPFTSKGGQQFLAIAKNRAWGDPAFGQPVQDFYNALVSVVLNENVDVETWENAGPKVPPEIEAGETHDVENMHSVNLAPLGIPWSWAEENDHAKLCISDRNNPADAPHWVCVGDINFTSSMEKRGGGTVAFICDPLWSALSQVLSAAEEKATRPTRGTRPAMGSGTGTAGAAKVPSASKLGTGKAPTRNPAPKRKKTAAAKRTARGRTALARKAAVKKGPSRKPAQRPASGRPAVRKSAARKAPARKTAVRRPAPSRPARKKGAARTAKRRPR